MKRWMMGAALIVAAGAIAASVAWSIVQPHSVFLRDGSGARWIRDGEPFYLGVHRARTVRFYRVPFQVSAVPPSAVLRMRATGDAVVFVDGRAIATLPSASSWSDLKTVELAPELTPGRHELSIQVTNALGPGVLEAEAATLDVHTDTHWLAMVEGGRWKPAALADAPVRSTISLEMSSRARGLSLLAWLLPALAVTLWLAVPRLPSAARLRWGVMMVWGIVAANNYCRLPLKLGMDYQGHTDYVQFILDHHSLPLATDGWQMFQSPFYYLLSAGLALPLRWLEPGSVFRALRLISIGCALAQIELSYRSSRLLFPQRDDLQSIAVLVGGLLPMNFYLSQVLGNEPLHGAFGALTLWLALRIAQRADEPLRGRDAVLLGLAWGLALLSKATALLLVVPLGWLFALRLLRRPTGRSRELAGALVVCTGAAAVAGWYYVRNWVLLGAPFVAGWMPARIASAPWWQEPGYRTVGQLMRWGDALTHPYFSAVNGFWDGFYSTLWADGMVSGKTTAFSAPPWNYAPMEAALWLSLLPTVLIALGVADTLAGRRDPSIESLRLAVVALVTTLAALLLLYVRVPIYGTVKATYTVSLTPCYGLLAAWGFHALGRSTLVRRAIMVALLTWAVTVVSAFVVV